MSELFLEQKRPSVKCHRKKHGECKNVTKSCGCECHRVAELQKEMDKGTFISTPAEALSY